MKITIDNHTHNIDDNKLMEHKECILTRVVNGEEYDNIKYYLRTAPSEHDVIYITRQYNQFGYIIKFIMGDDMYLDLMGVDEKQLNEIYEDAKYYNLIGLVNFIDLFFSESDEEILDVDDIQFVEMKENDKVETNVETKLDISEYECPIIEIKQEEEEVSDFDISDFSE